VADQPGDLVGELVVYSGGVGPRGNVAIPASLTELNVVLVERALPTIGSFVPAVMANLGANGTVQFDVRDNVRVIASSLRILVSFDGGVNWETVHNGVIFMPRYSAESSRTPLGTDGYRFVLKRRGGWPSTNISFDIPAIDTSGNVAV
jgi:hypothetical protein